MRMDDTTRDMDSLDFARLLVSTSRPSIDDCIIRVMVDDKVVPVSVQMEACSLQSQPIVDSSGLSGYTTMQSEASESNLVSETIVEETTETIVEETTETGQISGVGELVDDETSVGAYLAQTEAQTGVLQKMVTVGGLKIVDAQIAYLRFILKSLTKRADMGKPFWRLNSGIIFSSSQPTLKIALNHLPIFPDVVKETFRDCVFNQWVTKYQDFKKSMIVEARVGSSPSHVSLY